MNYFRITGKQLKNFIIKVLVLINLFSLLNWMCRIDYITSWHPVAIMLVNLVFLLLVGYVNSDIKSRKEKEDEF